MFRTIDIVFSQSAGFETYVDPAKKVATIFYPLAQNKLAWIAEYRYIGEVFFGKDPLSKGPANSTLLKISPSRAVWVGNEVLEFDLVGNEKILKFDSFGVSDGSAPVVWGTKHVYFPDFREYALKSEIKNPLAPWRNTRLFPIRNWKEIANRNNLQDLVFGVAAGTGAKTTDFFGPRK